jgi:CMP-N-acetylneuraminic acid synthetase
MLVHSIDHARASRFIHRTIVSTDSLQYAEIAKAAGAEVPFLRPADIAQDHSTDHDVFVHALEWLKEHEGYEPDICVHLRPTFPFRNVEDIDAMIQILLDHPELDSVRSIAPAPATPFKMWFRGDDHLLSPVVQTDIRDAHNRPRQLLPQAYLQNACIDVMRPQTILEKQSMTGDKIYGYDMERDFDIDTHDDIQRLESYLASQGMLPPVGSDGKRRICFDIDGVIAGIVPGNDYEKSQPREQIVSLVRRLHAEGHRIILFTARGSATGIDWRAITERQMQEWGVPYHELHFGKPAADFYVDDRAVPVDYLQALSA